MRFYEPNIDARRLINADDWKNAPHGLERFAYGSLALTNFLTLTEFIREDASAIAIDSDLLKQLHEISMFRMPFHGFEGRRLLDRHRKGELTKEEFKAALERAYRFNEELAGIPHTSLIGKFRSEEMDQITHRGSSFLPNGERYFTLDELEAARANPILRVDEASVIPIDPSDAKNGGFKAVVHYADVFKVGPLVEETLAKYISKIDGITRSRKENDESHFDRLVLECVRLERDLLSIHPFLDGNGRTVRAIVDLIFLRAGLPQPAHPNDWDMLMGEPELVEIVRQQMILTLRLWYALIENFELDVDDSDVFSFAERSPKYRVKPTEDQRSLKDPR